MTCVLSSIIICIITSWFNVNFSINFSITIKKKNLNKIDFSIGRYYKILMRMWDPHESRWGVIRCKVASLHYISGLTPFIYLLFFCCWLLSLFFKRGERHREMVKVKELISEEGGEALVTPKPKKQKVVEEEKNTEAQKVGAVANNESTSKFKFYLMDLKLLDCSICHRPQRLNSPVNLVCYLSTPLISFLFAFKITVK